MAAHDSVKKVNEEAANKTSFIGFFKEMRAELKRITWASKENVKKATATVLIFCLMYTVIVGLLDFGFKSLVGVVFK